MTALQLLRMCRAKPFRKFEMYLVDGRQLVVKHPELLILSGGGRIAIFQFDDESDEIIDVLMIVSLRTLIDSEVQTNR